MKASPSLFLQAHFVLYNDSFTHQSVLLSDYYIKTKYNSYITNSCISFAYLRE